MKVIDKDAHEVSIKEASIWTFVWIGLSLLFAKQGSLTLLQLVEKPILQIKVHNN